MSQVEWTPLLETSQNGYMHGVAMQLQLNMRHQKPRQMLNIEIIESFKCQRRKI